MDMVSTLRRFLCACVRVSVSPGEEGDISKRGHLKKGRG
jgi:hypothetical protein